MKFEPHPSGSPINPLQKLAMQAGGKSASASNPAKRAGGGPRGGDARSSSPGGETRSGRTVAVSIAVLGVLAVAWAVHSQWSKDSEAPNAEAPASAVPRDSGTSLAGPLSPFAVAPAPLPSAPRAAEAAAAQPAPQSAAVPANTAASAEAVLLEALSDPQEEVRYRSLEEAMGTDREVPQATLQELLANDPSDKVRELALQALTEQPEASREDIRSIVHGAVTNPSAAVRAHAQLIIERLNELDRMDEEARIASATSHSKRAL